MAVLTATYPCLRSKSVVITGGASGIGASLVTEFARQGSRVGFVDIDETAAGKLCDQLGSNVSFLPCDILDTPDLRKAIGALQDSWSSSVGILINNAGRDTRHAFSTLEPEEWEEMINVNLTHQFFASQAVVPGMIRAGGGSIINLGSTVVAMAAGNMPAYVAAKAGIQGLTRALARDLGKHRIRVNCILPGWIITERQLTKWFDETSEAKIVENQCLPDKLTPEDVAAMALFLASEGGRNCTAQSFVVDGGWT